MKKLFALLFILLIVVYSFEIKRQDITVTFSEPALVKEEYLVYLNESEYSLLNNTSLSDLSEYGIGYSVLSNVSNVSITVVKDDYSLNYRRVILEYEADLIKTLSQTGRYVKKGFNSSIFIFSNNGLLKIPYYVSITLRISPEYLDKIRLNGDPESSYIDSDGYKNFIWRGPLNTKDFTIYYEEEIPISGSFSEFLKHITQPAYIVAFFVICILAFIYRRQLKNVLYEVFS